MQAKRDWANRNAEFYQLQVALIYELDVKYLKSISNEESDPSTEKIKLEDIHQKSRFL